MVNKAEKDFMINFPFESFGISLGVSGVVIDKGKILLGKRKDLKIWGLPGGRVEKDETVEEALIREVEEETGIKVDEFRLSGIYLRTRWKKNLVFVFRCNKFSGDLRKSEETTEVKWFGLGEVNKVLNENLVVRVNDVLLNKKKVFIRMQNKVQLSLLIFWLKKYLKSRLRI